MDILELVLADITMKTKLAKMTKRSSHSVLQFHGLIMH